MLQVDPETEPPVSRISLSPLLLHPALIHNSRFWCQKHSSSQIRLSPVKTRTTEGYRWKGCDLVTASTGAGKPAELYQNRPEDIRQTEAGSGPAQFYLIPTGTAPLIRHGTSRRRLGVHSITFPAPWKQNQHQTGSWSRTWIQQSAHKNLDQVLEVDIPLIRYHQNWNPDILIRTRFYHGSWFFRSRPGEPASIRTPPSWTFTSLQQTGSAGPGVCVWMGSPLSQPPIRTSQCSVTQFGSEQDQQNS